MAAEDEQQDTDAAEAADSDEDDNRLGDAAETDGEGEGGRS